MQEPKDELATRAHSRRRNLFVRTNMALPDQRIEFSEDGGREFQLSPYTVAETGGKWQRALSLVHGWLERQKREEKHRARQARANERTLRAKQAPTRVEET